uniref:Uncharacterized protein n=1 Tax=Rubinisphaera brasiliensis (strain ATCC 49424 / DSM 5305 / JCM 21570 / IAM 15109 / NBRC 103401 / IFAM 1448) TaxID=756272 RepID=F0SR36_RUBBR|nr:hypothetical protein Plabr_3686 [Rubinisphaera brasiliensis DSM 5305]
MIVRHGWRLPPRHPEVQAGSVIVHGQPIDRRKSTGVFYNGALYEVREISQRELLDSGPRDAFLEWQDRELEFVRYLKVGTSQDASGLVVTLANRYDLTLTHREPLAEFRPRRILQVLRVQGLPGFHIHGCKPFLRGE